MNENILENSENELPAEMGRVYHAEDSSVSSRPPQRQILSRALVFGCIAALALFAADAGYTGNGQAGENNIPPDSSVSHETETAPPVSSTDSMTPANNILTHISEGICHAAAVMSIASARLQLWDFAGTVSGIADVSAGENVRNNPPENDNTINSGGQLTLSESDSGILSHGVRRMPSSLDEEGDVDEAPMPSGEHSGSSPLPYASCGDGAGGDIIRQTFTSGTGENYIDLPLGGQIRNVTSLSREEIIAQCGKAPDFSIEINSDKPQVLIMHTHTTETYERSERDRYDSDFLSRTTDSDMNMTAVGRAMTDVLNSHGINTIHDETIHDFPSYNGSYDRSRETVAAILREYPSIKVVLDVHRDAIEREGGVRVAPSVNIGGKSAAQIMIICGCDDGSMDMPNCMLNLRTAALFQQHIEGAYPGLTRPVLFDYRSYNQDMTTGSLLIEVGGHANSIDEAVYAGQLTAEGIAKALVSY